MRTVVSVSMMFTLKRLHLFIVFIDCWYFIQKIVLNQLSPYKAAHQIDNQLITLLNIDFLFCFL